MTEERARHYAETLAHSMGITFYVVRSREGRFLTVQTPSDAAKSWPPSRHPAARTSRIAGQVPWRRCFSLGPQTQEPAYDRAGTMVG